MTGCYVFSFPSDRIHFSERAVTSVLFLQRKQRARQKTDFIRRDLQSSIVYPFRGILCQSWETES